MVSEAFLDETRKRSDLSIESEPAPPKFDSRNDLVPVFGE